MFYKHGSEDLVCSGIYLGVWPTTDVPMSRALDPCSLPSHLGPLFSNQLLVARTLFPVALTPSLWASHMLSFALNLYFFVILTGCSTELQRENKDPDLSLVPALPSHVMWGKSLSISKLSLFICKLEVIIPAPLVINNHAEEQMKECTLKTLYLFKKSVLEI